MHLCPRQTRASWAVAYRQKSSRVERLRLVLYCIHLSRFQPLRHVFSLVSMRLTEHDLKDKTPGEVKKQTWEEIFQVIHELQQLELQGQLIRLKSQLTQEPLAPLEPVPTTALNLIHPRATPTTSCPDTVVIGRFWLWVGMETQQTRRTFQESRSDLWISRVDNSSCWFVILKPFLEKESYHGFPWSERTNVEPTFVSVGKPLLTVLVGPSFCVATWRKEKDSDCPVTCQFSLVHDDPCHFLFSRKTSLRFLEFDCFSSCLMQFSSCLMQFWLSVEWYCTTLYPFLMVFLTLHCTTHYTTPT